MDTLKEGMRDRPPFAGELSFISLADIFQILGGNNSTGVLYLNNPYADSPGIIYFENGDPINAALGSLYGTDAICALFGWTIGSFEFRQERVYAGKIVKQSRMQIVLDALRMLDDGLIEKVGPASVAEEDVTDKKGNGLIFKRPFVDYLYIIDEEEFPDGEVVVKEGAHGKWTWVILEGQVKITRETSTGPLTISQLGEGSFLGSITSFLFSEYERSATVTALGNVRLGLLDSQRLHEEYSLLSRDFRDLLLSLAGRLRKITDRAVELSLSSNDHPEIPKETKVIVKRGAQDDMAFVILSGKGYVVGETSEGPIPLMTLNEKDFFGHVPFIETGHEPQTASIFGSEDLEIRLIDTKKLQQEYTELSSTFKNLIEHSCHSLSYTTRLVYRLHEGVEK